MVSLEDRPTLDMLMRDDSAPMGIKILASILRHVTHTPTEDDKAKLRALLLPVNRRGTIRQDWLLQPNSSSEPTARPVTLLHLSD
jgi:hypothetical protein